MGLYSINEGTSAILDNVGEIPFEFSNFDEGTASIIAETEYNYNRMIKAVGIQELHALETTGAEMIYEAGDVKAFIEKAKQFFLNLWKKIQGLFTKFFAMFDAYIKTDKEFLTKYKSKIIQGSVKGLKVKGFEYTTDVYNGVDLASHIDSINVNQSNDSLKTAVSNEDSTEYVEKLRAELIKSGSSLTSSEYRKEIYEKLRNGESTKEDMDVSSIAKYIAIIEKAKQKKKDAENKFKTVKETINKTIKNLNNDEKELLKQKTDDMDSQSLKIRAVNINIARAKALLNEGQILNSAILTAIKDENRQAKSICIKTMGRKATTEGTIFDSEDGTVFGEGGILDSVDFV